jgi:hypothetical protein
MNKDPYIERNNQWKNLSIDVVATCLSDWEVMKLFCNGCIDAPDMIPSGSMKSHMYLTRSIPVPQIHERE